MRNFLIALMLCVLTLTTSNVFAEGYDESRRTERFGLSFYDGRPLYVVGFGRLPGNSFSAPTRCLVYRVYTGDKLSDYGTSDYGDGRGEQIYENGQYVEMMFYHYVLDDAGEPVILSTSGSFAPGNESQFVSYHLKNLTFTVSGGDLAVETYDNILPNAQDWARRGILLAVALLVISAGSNKFRELTSGETQTTVKEEKKADATSSQEERATVRKIREAAKLGKLGGGLDERFLSESERREYDFITGKAFGLEFDDKVRASNKLFLDAFNRLPRYEQEALLQEWRVSSYTESYQGSVERRFIDWREGSGNDGATSRKQTDAFDNWFGSSDPFNDNDEEDGEPPF